MKRLVQNLLRGRMATKEMNINCVCALIRDVSSFLSYVVLDDVVQ